MLRERPNNRIKWMVWLKPTEPVNPGIPMALRVDAYTRVLEYPLAEVSSAQDSKDVVSACMSAIRQRTRRPDWVSSAGRGLELGDALYAGGNLYMYVADTQGSHRFAHMDIPTFVQEFEDFHFGGT